VIEIERLSDPYTSRYHCIPLYRKYAVYMRRAEQELETAITYKIGSAKMIGSGGHNDDGLERIPPQVSRKSDKGQQGNSQAVRAHPITLMQTLQRCVKVLLYELLGLGIREQYPYLLCRHMMDGALIPVSCIR
jgi:hypothetical protein